MKNVELVPIIHSDCANPCSLSLLHDIFRNLLWMDSASDIKNAEAEMIIQEHSSVGYWLSTVSEFKADVKINARLLRPLSNKYNWRLLVAQHVVICKQVFAKWKKKGAMLLQHRSISISSIRATKWNKPKAGKERNSPEFYSSSEWNMISRCKQRGGIFAGSGKYRSRR